MLYLGARSELESIGLPIEETPSGSRL